MLSLLLETGKQHMIWYPKRPESLEDARVRRYFIQDNILKILYVRGVTRGVEFSDILRLPYTILDDELRHLRDNHSIVPVGGAGIGGYDGMDFNLTKQGRELAAELYRSSPYIGPAAVDIQDYLDSVKKQRFQARWIKKSHLENAFSDIVLSPDYLNQLGPAINSGGPIFLYGKPGNGKTTIAERLARIFRQGIFVPYAIQIDGQIIQFFDEKVHKLIPIEALPDTHPVKTDPRSIDSRWAYVYRPFIIVGGELTLEMLDLIFRDGQHCYEAPFQLKANCGVLLVDDFGRQIVKPKDFLNRWIFPLEKGVDFLTLVTGKKVEVPFEQILIFSTNLDPKDLADEAFWRRIKYKIAIPNPSEDEFKRIFKAVCEQTKNAYDEASFQYLVDTHYHKANREMRAVHPRDILNHAKDYIFYTNLESKLTTQLIDLACTLYFGSVQTHTSKGWALS